MQGKSTCTNLREEGYGSVLTAQPGEGCIDASVLAMNTFSRWSVLTLKCKAIASTVVHRPYHQFKLTDYETCELMLCALTVTEPELTGLDTKSGFFVTQKLNQ